MSTAMKASQEPNLAEQTRRLRDEFLAGLDESDRARVVEAFGRLQAATWGSGALTTGDRAKDFTLVNARGGHSRLSEYLERGPVVLSFYRGGWCPYCNLEFRALMRRLPDVQALGATLVGVSPETPDNSMSTVERNHLEFEVLSDVGNRVAREWGLVMWVDEDIRDLHLAWGLDIPAANGDDSWELPIPATYVIDRDGVIRAAHVEKDYTQRMEPDEIVFALRAL